jgi:hypothetical protein
VLKFSFITLLTPNTVESVKITGSLEKFPHTHLMHGQHILHLSLIKTRKNWIIKDVLAYETVCKPTLYTDYIKLADLLKIIIANTHEDQEHEIFQFIITSLQNISTLTASAFEKELLSKLGF